MKLKKLHLSLLALGTIVCNLASAQLLIDQAVFTIQSGATVTVQGNVTSNVDILGTGKVILKGTANQDINMGGFSVPNLEVDNTSNVTLTNSVKVPGDLLFTNGKVLIGNHNLIIGNAGTITNATSAKYVVTNGSGKLLKAALAAAAFVYPIGNSTSSYNPVSIANTGTADSIGARAFATVMTAGTSGAAIAKEVVNNSWDITESVAGNSVLSVTATWSGAQELAGFDRARGGISNYITAPAASVGWDLLNSQATTIAGTLTGANPYTYTRTGISSLGTFAIGTRPVLSPLLVSPKVFLQGAFNTGTAVMTDALRIANLIPAIEPYTGLGSITAPLRGSGGGETAANTVVGSAAGVSTNTTIVDWILVQLHRTTDGVVVSQRAALVQRGGTVVDTDGSSPVNLAGNAAGSYYVSVRHRNHLGVRSAAGIALAKTSNTAYNFTTAQSQAFAGVVTNNPMATLVASTTFGLWGGNANANANVKYSGPSNDELQLLNTCLSGNKAATVAGYLNCDLNLNGAIKYSGPGNDEIFLLNTVLSGNKANIITQPTF
jgi:hypothetical protein